MSISLTSIIDGNEEARTFVSVWLSFPVSRYCSRTKRFGSNCLPYAIEQSYYSKEGTYLLCLCFVDHRQTFFRSDH